MEPSIPPTSKELTALGYPEDKLLALKVLKDRHLRFQVGIHHRDEENFGAQCKNVIIEFAKTIAAASNMLTAVENAEELQVLVGELSKLESLAKVEQEKIEQDKEVKQLRQEQEILKNKNIHTRTVEKQGEENRSAESTNHSKPFRRPSRPPPAVPISQNGEAEETNDGKVEEKAFGIANQAQFEDFEMEIDSMFGQFDGLKRLAMIIGIEEAVPIIDRVNILQTAIADNVSKPKDAVRDVALMRSDLNLLKSLVAKNT